MVPIYSGITDFNINGRIISTHILMPLTQNQKELIKQASSNVKAGDYRYKFIKHLEYLADWQKYPEHLQKKKETKKKGKTKIKYEKIREYIDLETGKEYIKNKENEYVAIESEGR